MIGAHMESDGAEIIDIAPGEAELLIGLIETLIVDSVCPGKSGGNG